MTIGAVENSEILNIINVCLHSCLSHLACKLHFSRAILHYILYYIILYYIILYYIILYYIILYLFHTDGQK
jgi:hypothetical protein